MYYIEKADKLCGINKIIKKVKIQENKITIAKYLYSNVGNITNKSN